MQLHNNDYIRYQQNVDVESIIERAIGGDAEAFGRLYDMYADRIYRHVYYRTGSIEDARDLTQEVFIRAWQALPKYKRTTTPFLGWLFTISHNRVIDYYRTKKNFAYLNDTVIVQDAEADPEHLAEAQLTQQDIRRAILQLPQEQQQVILMSFIEGFKYSEIAAVLHKTEGNIRVIIHRALKKMHEIMSKSG